MLPAPTIFVGAVHKTAMDTVHLPGGGKWDKRAEVIEGWLKEIITDTLRSF